MAEGGGPRRPATGRRRTAASAVGLALVVLVAAALLAPGRFEFGRSSPHQHPSEVANPGNRAAPQVDSPPRSVPQLPSADGETCADGRDPTASLSPSDQDGEAVRRIKKDNRLVVGVDQNSYLWGYLDPDSGELTGFDIDLVKAIAKELLGPHPQVVYKTIPTDQRLDAVTSGEVDMVVRTMTINCERSEQVAYSTSYFEGGQQILAPKSSRIDGYNASLDGKRVCTARGSTGQAQLSAQTHGSTPVYVENQLDCLVQLQLGQVDAVFTDNGLAAGQAAQDPTVRLVGEPVTAEPYGVAMNLADEDLVRRVNHVLQEYCEGGESSLWRKAYDKWLADVMSDPAPAPPKARYRD